MSLLIITILVATLLTTVALTLEDVQGAVKAVAEFFSNIGRLII